jgi:hypothetical protein
MRRDIKSCPQLAEEAQRVSSHTAEAAGAQDSQATKDAVGPAALSSFLDGHVDLTDAPVEIPRRCGSAPRYGH